MLPIQKDSSVHLALSFHKEVSSDNIAFILYFDIAWTWNLYKPSIHILLVITSQLNSKNNCERKPDYNHLPILQSTYFVQHYWPYFHNITIKSIVKVVHYLLSLFWCIKTNKWLWQKVINYLYLSTQLSRSKLLCSVKSISCRLENCNIDFFYCNT